jgi:hypothetical protein
VKIISLNIALFFLIILISGCIGNDLDSDDKDITKEIPLFEYPPFDLDKIVFIEPMGSMIGNHITPIDHQYYMAIDHMSENPELIVDVYSPADGVIINIQHMNSLPGDQEFFKDDYRLVLKHSEKIFSVYIHVDNLTDKISSLAPPPGEYSNTNIYVEAGEIIGTFTGTVDYNIIDENITLTGFINPESYQIEPWKIHTPDPFNYFDEHIKTKMIEKCLRYTEPFGGKIDYDIDGKLVGSWFRENTNGYAGINSDKYWIGHLSIVYNSIDPNHIIVSFGDYNGYEKQFGVKNNSPDPAIVDTETGMIKYELVDYDFYNKNEHWDRKSLIKGLKIKNNPYVQGVVLFQLIEEKKLKVEFFPNEKIEDINEFTENLLIYER